MANLLDNYLQYLRTVTGRVAAWENTPAVLPPYLSEQYALRAIALGDRWTLAIMLKQPESFRPAAFEKQLPRLLDAAKNTGLEGYLVLAEDLPAYIRARLVERQIPFVVPGRQIHWPQLGQMYRERALHGAPTAKGNVSPVTQAILLLYLNRRLTKAASAKELANAVGVSAMSASRALNEIEANNLGAVSRQGRKRQLIITEQISEVWEKARPLMKSPITRTIHLKQSSLRDMPAPKAGETALAERTMLAAPPEPVYAIYVRTWHRLMRDRNIAPDLVRDDDTCQLQLWSYDPIPFAEQGSVDPYSLYLSLENHKDERVEQAREQLKEALDDQGT